jgi:flagellar basal-body rod protein FlgF
MGSSGPIDVSSPGARILASGGVVDADGNELGRLRIVEFEDPSRLSKTGDGLFEAPYDVNAQTVETPSILAGSLEGSNVQPVVELATLVILQRAFDASIQAMQREDQATESLIREISQ